MRTDFIYQKIKSVRIKRYLLRRAALPLRGVAGDNGADVAQGIAATYFSYSPAIGTIPML